MNTSTEKQYNLKNKMTDRRRREILDEKFQKRYPGESPEKIRQIREQYVADNFRKRRYYLPQPEKKEEIRKETLSLEEIAKELTKKHYLSIGKANGAGNAALSILNFLLLFAWCAAVLFVLFNGTVLDKVLSLLIAVPNFWMYCIKRMKGSVLLYPVLMDGGLTAQEWTVEDLEWDYESDSENSWYSYSLLLVRENNQRMAYPINAEEYARLREGDKVYLLFFNTKKLGHILKQDMGKPVYMIEADCWNPDEPLKKLLNQQFVNKRFAEFEMFFGETHSDSQTEGEKKVRKNTVILILSTLLVFGLAIPAAIQYSRKIIIPDPSYFFGTDKLVFETIPEPALETYCNLLVENYGFINRYPDNPLWNTTFVNKKEEKYKLHISSDFKKDGVVRIRITYSSYCNGEPMETWDGDLSGLLLLPPRWMDCTVCKGTGDCRKCDGRGYISGSIDERSSDCLKCKKSGECTECYWGKVKDPSSEPIDWNDPSTINQYNWKKAVEEVFKNSPASKKEN